MVNITKYKKYRNGFGLYSIVHTVSKTSESLNNEYPNRTESNLDLVWKKMVIQGLEYALSKIHHIICIEIILKDIEGHIMHSNNYSMLAAGILATFAELNVEIDEEDIENLYEFVESSKEKDLDAIPDVDKLVFKTYRI